MCAELPSGKNFESSARRGNNVAYCATLFSGLSSNLSEPSWADADLFALRDAPMTRRRVGGDAGTKQRGVPGEVDVGRDVRTKPSSSTMLSEVDVGPPLCPEYLTK